METPLPYDSRGGTPLPSVLSEGTGSHSVSAEGAFHKRVSFQDLHLEERPSSRPRPLPPIGCERVSDDPLPPKGGRRLPPLTPLDALSLYSISSHSQLFCRPASTHSLPLPDPRYSSSSSAAAEEVPALLNTRRASSGTTNQKGKYHRHNNNF